LATNLYSLPNIDDTMVQKILRHGDVGVTGEHPIKTNQEQAKAAIVKFESHLDALCSDCAQPGIPIKSGLVN
jgi:hypothetical protein